MIGIPDVHVSSCTSTTKKWSIPARHPDKCEKSLRHTLFRFLPPLLHHISVVKLQGLRLSDS